MTNAPDQPGPPGWPYGPPGYPAYGPPPAPHPDANRALALGIVALAGGITCGFPMLVSPFAWALGQRVVREIDASPVPQHGRGEAKAGMILGVIGTAILGLVVLVVILFLAVTSAGGI